MLQNRRPDQERTKTWGHDMRVLLSTYGGRGEPLVGLAVREVLVIRSASAVHPSAVQRSTAASEVSW